MTKYPDFNFERCRESIPCLLKFKKSEDSLKLLNLDEDEFLYKEALIKSDYITNCNSYDWFIAGGSMFDFSLVKNNLKKLLKDYPESNFASKAELYLMGNGRGDEGEEQFSFENIKLFNNFLIKYPNSDVIPQVRVNISGILAAYTGDVDSSILYKKKSLEELEKIDFQNLKDFSILEDIKNRIIQTKIDIRNLIFKLKLVPLQKKYTLQGEKKFLVSIKNNTSKAQSIKLFSRECPVLTNLRLNIPFNIDKIQNNKTQLISILPKDSINFIIDLQKQGRHWKGNKLCKYRFIKKGKCNLNIKIADDEQYGSNDLEFYIE